MQWEGITTFYLALPVGMKNQVTIYYNTTRHKKVTKNPPFLIQKYPT